MAPPPPLQDSQSGFQLHLVEPFSSLSFSKENGQLDCFKETR